jgi:hypothetical protein
MNISDKYCTFCKTLISKKNRSKEHIIPQWLLNFLDLTEHQVQPTHFNPNGDSLSTRKHKLSDFVQGKICSTCNNGWMSRLEESSIPVLIPLMKGEKLVDELDSMEKAILSRWTAKTAYVLNTASNFHKSIPQDHFEYVRKFEDKLPNNVWAFGQNHNGIKKFGWLQSSTWLLNGISQDEAKNIDLNKISYKISFQFGKLLLLIAYLPMKNANPILWKNIHVPLNRKASECLYHNNVIFEREDSEMDLDFFHLKLEALINY